MRNSLNISKVARYAFIFLRACFLMLVMAYLTNGLFPDNPDHFDAEPIESSENHEHEAEDENEGNKKETEQDDHLKLFYNYGFTYSSTAHLIDGDLFAGGSIYLENSTPPPEHI